MPHGGIALDPTHFNTTNATALKQAWELHHACVAVGQEIAQLNPDLIVLSTPHGVSHLRDFVLYTNPTAEGNAETDNCHCPPCCYNASIQIDVNMTEKIIGSLNTLKNVWGEVIPVHFIPNLKAKNIKFVIVSHPSRRYTQDVQMIPELRTLGASLYTVLENYPKTVVVIVSGDLAHTHQASGPYGYSNTSEPFDEACGSWVATLDAEFQLVKAASIVDKALSCGFTGFVALQGLMEAGGLHTWKSRVLVNHHPSYYGMMVASFQRHVQ
ncbi:protein ca_c1420-like [Plakobranchus ocellatus]|uniref:Protein ca_c1420-like n=1 Tax=Plakobranchus ocellatus TaxID=259542 RepID=A0AAV3Z484_9GAST|nr:protein ca_c1420-like [Plakobranchus ocellatus]